MNLTDLARRTAVVVLNWNGFDDTSQCLASLARLNPAPGRVIVVDNGSTDGSAERLRAVFPWAHVVATSRNLGYAGGNNVGIRLALGEGADYVWVLNNDTVVEPGALGALLQRMTEDPTIAMCGSTLVHSDPPGVVQALGGASYDPWTGTARGVGAGLRLGSLPSPSDVEPRLDYVAGASVLVTRRFLETAGLMDEGYFLFFEELDWAARLPPGTRLGWAASSVVHHKDGATIGRNRDDGQPMEKRLRYEYFMLRSRFRYTAKHDPWRLPVVVAITLATLALRLARGQPLRAWVLARALVAVATGLGVPPSARELMRSARA